MTPFQLALLVASVPLLGVVSYALVMRWLLAEALREFAPLLAQHSEHCEAAQPIIGYWYDPYSSPTTAEFFRYSIAPIRAEPHAPILPGLIPGKMGTDWGLIRGSLANAEPPAGVNFFYTGTTSHDGAAH